MMRTAVAIAAVVIIAAGCSRGDGAEPEVVGSGAADSNAAGPRFDYQLGGAYDVTGGLDVVVRDATASAMPGAVNICYINGFQTQPGRSEEWADDLLLRDAAGEEVIDPDWPDEFVLDPSDADKRSRIDAIVGSVVDECAAAGFAAVEIDNLDVWTRFPTIDRGAVLELARLYADRVHTAGMEIAQKNSPDDAADFRADVGFDFVIAEECVAFDECFSYSDAYGSRVYDIEYTDNLAGSFESMCDNPDRPAITILRDRELVLPSDSAYEYRQCAPVTRASR